MKNVVIIGAGPAGISAALYTARGGIKTTVVGKGLGALEKVDRLENYYGFAEPMNGKELATRGINQARNVGAEIIYDEVVGLGYDDKFIIKTISQELSADCVIMAMGTSRKTPDINGFDKFEGKGISYCATCDGFFYKNKNVAVLGCCEYAIAEAMELMPIVKSVTIITNGHQPNGNFPAGIKIIETKVKEFVGQKSLEKVVFVDDTELQVSGVFIAIGVAGSAELVKKIGAMTIGNIIAVEATMATNIPGLFAAGDCTGGMLQIAKAVYEGAVAGKEAIKFLQK